MKMRNIKFRGKKCHYENGDITTEDIWVYGGLLHHNCETKIYDRNGCTYTVDPDTVGLYIGSKDNNKKEIYEGDKVKCMMHYAEDYLPCSGTIKYSEFHSSFVLENDAGETLMHNFMQTSISVVGNIHEGK
jgi:hypothetical protein